MNLTIKGASQRRGCALMPRGPGGDLVLIYDDDNDNDDGNVTHMGRLLLLKTTA